MNNNKYKDTGLGRIGNAISQLGHAIAWGASDVSISSKSGYMSEMYPENKTWRFFKWFIDFAFAPIDGEDHGGKALRLDPDENYEIGIGRYQNIVCGIFIIPVCSLVTLLLYTYKGVINFVKFVRGI